MKVSFSQLQGTNLPHINQLPSRSTSAPPPPKTPQQQHIVPYSLHQNEITLSNQIRISLVALTAASIISLSPSTALAADSKAVGNCLLRSCQSALATCLGDVQCLENLVCLQLCSSAEDETSCQIKCGDKYADKAIETFNSCAVSEKKCVPQRVDDSLFPIPPDCSLDNTFDVAQFQGRWFITAGLNPLFDMFDCQEHFFASPEPNKLFGKINWRITKGNDGDFIERSTMQRFVQDPEHPSILYNHDNEYLHYQDDWYILAFKPDSYALIYYRGENDAWKGYGGATLYTRSPNIPEEIIPEVKEAAERAGLDWGKFKVTDNSCGPHPPAAESLVEEVEKELVMVEGLIEKELVSFGKGFTVLEKKLEGRLEVLEREVEKEEMELAREAKKAARMIAKFEREADGDGGNPILNFFFGKE